MPGVSVAIIFPDGTTWVGTSGMADVAARTPVTPDTAFAIASISKTFTAALILALVDEGRIDLETAGRRRTCPSSRSTAGITVRQLLDHTSGLHDFFFHPAIDKALLLDDRVGAGTRPRRSGTSGKPYFKPGQGWHYSNTNYLVLGLLAERVGGAPLADQLRDALLRPARPRRHVLPGRPRRRAARWPTATGSPRRGRCASRSTSRDGIGRSCRSPRS